MTITKAKAKEAFIKTIGFAGCVLLTTFAGIFAMMSLSAFVVSIIEKDIFSVMACVIAAVIAKILWDVRKDTLV